MFDVEETIRRRKSIRSYENRPLSQADRTAIRACMEELCREETPFPAQMQMCLLETKAGSGTEKLGTYGVIRGANTFIGIAVEDTEAAMEAVGYTFEKLVLTATAMGLGTCWLAGTFNREQFAGAMNLQEGQIFPIVSPIGYIAEKNTLVNTLFRTVGRSDQRKPWPELFFENDFTTALTEASAGDYAFPLEMLRLAPSAANRQPWRVVLRDDAFHFYRQANPKAKYSYDLQRLDVGIGACHFHLAAADRGLAGSFAKLSETGIAAPEHMKYLFSWIKAQ